jgi:hypothetical protein
MFCDRTQLAPLLVSLGKEERKVKNKNRRKMKDMKFYDRNGGITEHNTTENQVQLYYVSRKSMQ